MGREVCVLVSRWVSRTREVRPHSRSARRLWGWAVRRQCALSSVVTAATWTPVRASPPRLLGMCRPCSPLVTGLSVHHSPVPTPPVVPISFIPNLCSHLWWTRLHMAHPGPPHDLISHHLPIPPSPLRSPLLRFRPSPPAHSNSHTPLTQLQPLVCFLSVSPPARQPQEGEDPPCLARCCLPDA